MKRSLRTRFFLSHLLPMCVMLLALVGAVAGFSRLGYSVDHILRDNYQSVVAAQNMKEALERIDDSATTLLAGQSAEARAEYTRFRPQFEAAYRSEATNITEPGEQQLADDLGREWTVYQRDIERMLGAVPPLSTETTRRGFYFGTLRREFMQLKRGAQDVLDLNQAAIIRADERAKGEAQRDVIVGIVATATASLLAVALAWRLIAALLTPLVSLTRQAEEIGAGRLNGRIDDRRSDEIGQLAHSFNQMTERLADARQREETRFRRAERMSDAALENLYDPVIVTDAEGKIIHLNHAAEGLFGPEALARGRRAYEVVREERLARAIERAIEQRQTSAEEGEAAQITFGSDAAKRTYRLRVSPMQDGGNGDSGLLGAVAVLEDVTYQTQLDRLKTEFIGVASHELRTPVTSLLLGVQLLQEGAVGSLTSAQQQIVDATREDLDRLGSMMQDLLDVTRLEAGATPPRFEIVPAAELARAAVQSVEVQASAKGVLLTTTYDNSPTPLRLRADRPQMIRVLVNLLVNAIRHTPSGGTVTLRTGSAPDDARVLFTVSDTGTGIPAAYLSHIFERFVQVPGATRGGAGLGLSIAQNVVHGHRGEISAASELGKGSVFTVTLPAASAVSAAPETKEEG